MKLFFVVIASNLVALSCVGAAAWMALEGKGGWGWFLFVAFVCACAPTGKDEAE